MRLLRGAVARAHITLVTQAKRDATRAARIATLLGQVGEGKALHWKYQSK